jgi:hypothetical protein
VNHGPLLWHFESSPTPAERAEKPEAHGSAKQETGNDGIGEPGSFELPDDAVKKLIERMGFVILESSQSDATGTLCLFHYLCHAAAVGAATDLVCFLGYIQDPRSMLQNVYRPSFWVARKT